ncbi:major facilitator superfamily domain-containing protein [Aspergillus tamarii]|uniref:Major facilitator superfamily domain-containing protein n=1 Tax=Aspergillus tamarii TaxID=41984 RepID=A0A5N6V200_ASPTM|nr:major facilitator superfamily domain-containing protein [Aspergillus tamarii]
MVFSSALIRRSYQAGITQNVLDFHYRGSGTSRDPYVVIFIDNDPINPLNFPQWKKWTITILQAFAVLAVAFASTAYASGVSEVMQEFQVSRTVAILGITIFVSGFAFGMPLIWAPLSELYGRQTVFFITYMALAVFSAGSAGAPNIACLIVMRALAGTFGSSPLTNAGGVIAATPTGPIVAGLMACLTGTLWIIISLSVPETYAPVVLSRRAEKLSKLIGNIYISNLGIGKPKMTLGTEFKAALSRSWALLFTEPIVLFMSLFVAIIYGTLYMIFAAFPIVFQTHRGCSLGIGSLAFLGIAIGVILGVCYSFRQDGGNLSPEARLPPAILGSILLPIGLFWFAWTNSTSIHWVPVFLSAMNYLIDSYVVYASSVPAANSILHTVIDAAFPLFTNSMHYNLGIHWESLILAFLAFVCLPFPILFYRYGET